MVFVTGIKENRRGSQRTKQCPTAVPGSLAVQKKAMKRLPSICHRAASCTNPSSAAKEDSKARGSQSPADPLRADPSQAGNSSLPAKSKSMQPKPSQSEQLSRSPTGVEAAKENNCIADVAISREASELPARSLGSGMQFQQFCCKAVNLHVCLIQI